MKRTESTVYPEETQLLQGVLLVNYDVQEEVRTEEDGTEYTMYNYGQSRLQKDATESDIAKCIADGTEYWVKYRKDHILDTLVVTTNTVPFDADNTSINYMSSVLSVANFRMLEAMVAGTSVVDAYNAVFKTTIPWRNANNTNSNVQLETVAEALENCMTEVGTVKTNNTYNL